MGGPMTNESLPWPSPPQETTQPQDQVLTEENLPTPLTYKPTISRTMSQPTSAHVQTRFPQSPASATTARQLPSPVTTSLGSTCMQPTWRGFIHTTRDGLMLLEACLQGHLSHIPRRPHDRERQSIISSGNIFVYEENASGIRRWTDGITWSPSRIMGNFLVYRELRDGHQPGEKKRAAKKRKRGSEDLTNADSSKSEEDRQLIGSLSLDAYNFKPGGLAKKTLSVELRGVRHHIISYYRVEDVKNGLYHRPTRDEFLRNLEPRRELVENPSFKFPVEDRDDKVSAMVSPNSQLQPSHQLHRQMVNAGYPVVVNVPQHSAHLPHSLSPHGTSAPHPHQSRVTAGSYHLPVGPLDPFDLDPMQPVPSDQLHRSSTHQTPTSPHASTPIKSMPPTVRQIRPSSEQTGERDTKRQRPAGSQVMYWDHSPQISQGMEWSFPSSMPSYPNKYVEDVPYHGNFMSHEFSHQSVYMLPQGQSYSG